MDITDRIRYRDRKNSLEFDGLYPSDIIGTSKLAKNLAADIKYMLVESAYDAATEGDFMSAYIEAVQRLLIELFKYVTNGWRKDGMIDLEIVGKRKLANWWLFEDGEYGVVVFKKK